MSISIDWHAATDDRPQHYVIHWNDKVYHYYPADDTIKIYRSGPMSDMRALPDYVNNANNELIRGFVGCFKTGRGAGQHEAMVETMAQRARAVAAETRVARLHHFIGNLVDAVKADEAIFSSAVDATETLLK